MIRNRAFWTLVFILSVTMIGAILLTGSAVASEPRITANKDGTPLAFDVQPRIIRGRVMVPLRTISENLGAAVDWNLASSTVTIKQKSATLVLTVNSTGATRNGQQITLDSPAVIIRGRTLVPLRFISEALGFGIIWDEQARSVSIMTRLDNLSLLGPISPLTFPFLHLAEGDALRHITRQTQVHIARTVDMLRAQALAGDIHFAAMPTYVAANLYNRGVNLRLINVSVWGSLYIVGEAGAPVRALEDLKGQRLVIPSRGDMPDILFRFLANRKGLNIERDLQIEYVPSPMEAAQLLAAGRARYAVLSEPAATTALLRARQEGRTLERLITLRTVWGEVTGGPDRIPQAGIVALPNIVGQEATIRAFSEAYAQAVSWTVANPEDTGALAARRIEGLQAPAAASALRFSELRAIPAIEARREIEVYFRHLSELSPEIIGGKLPDGNFYWQPK